MPFDPLIYKHVFLAKRRVISRLCRMIRPLLHPSGYVDHTEPDERLKIYVFHNAKGERWPIRIPKAVGNYGTFYPYNREDERTNAVLGFFNGGVLTDAWGGGLVTVGFDHLPVEDLIRLTNIVERRIAEGKDKPYVPESEKKCA